jgi:AAA15 family ATPase/GTPase
MLIEFKIKNFASIKSVQTLSMLASADDTLEDYYIIQQGNLKLLKLAVLYGPNASGKTTILKALDFLRQLVLKPKNQKSDRLNFLPFQFDANSKKEPSWMQISFIQNQIKYDYEILFTKKCILEEKLHYYPKGRQSLFYSRTTDVKDEISVTQWGTTLKMSPKQIAVLDGNTLWNEPVLAAFNKSNIKSESLNNVKHWFNDYLQMMIHPNMNLTQWAIRFQESSTERKANMVELLKKADVQINNVELVEIDKSTDSGETAEVTFLAGTLIKDNGIEKNSDEQKITVPITNIEIERFVYFHHKVKNEDGTTSEYPLDLQYESHGTRQYHGLTAILSAAIKESMFHSIDEIETALHPDLMKHFILTFLANAKQSQMIVTTHNLFFLDEKDVFRKDVIWFTQKKADGTTELYSLADFDAATFRKNASVINAYKIGKLGAKPNLGTIFMSNP